MSPLYYAGALFLLIPALYTYAVSVIQTRLPRLQNKRICLLIAHPDDEAMFFAPTVLALTRADAGNHVKILCLSSGNAAGLGETRKKELVKSALALGVRSETDVWVIDRPDDFPDSMTTDWPSDKIAALLSEAFSQPDRRDGSPGPEAAPTAAIDVLITFDETGVSSHPNHISLYHGARSFLVNLMRGREGLECPVDLYVLRSVSVFRKYLSIGDIPSTVLSVLFGKQQGGGRGGGGEPVRIKDESEDENGGDREGEEGAAAKVTGDHPGALLFVNRLAGDGGLGCAWGAMTNAHESQMVWFRWLWIIFSRYMVINDLTLEEMP